MGLYQKGILGGFQGKIGTVVGATWKGIEYMRSRGKKITKPASLDQLKQQGKFSLIIGFLSNFTELLATSFRDSAIKMTGANSAFAYNFRNAITGDYPAYALDYSKVLLSKGQLHNAANTTATAAGAGTVKFDWTDNSGIAMANATDKAILVVYCPTLNRAVFTMDGTPRSGLTHTLSVSSFTGQTVQTWIAFISAGGADVASSYYTGDIVVA